MAKIERGYFEPSETFLALSDKFAEAVIAKFKGMGVSLIVQKNQNGSFVFTAADEVYVLHNDGVCAVLEFIGIQK